ncbi:hypothetical protein [Pseudonocardia sp. D17]|uniref:hypothetical protein n=1 Tax=Pseudonocardia sp. D17 TaxID=882661 RepID=UPI002B3E4620|nr:hypothetical protein PSD17_64670 [Pseudonocardia sp. D17]
MFEPGRHFPPQFRKAANGRRYDAKATARRLFDTAVNDARRGDVTTTSGSHGSTPQPGPESIARRGRSHPATARAAKPHGTMSLCSGRPSTRGTTISWPPPALLSDPLRGYLQMNSKCFPLIAERPELALATRSAAMQGTEQALRRGGCMTASELIQSAKTTKEICQAARSPLEEDTQTKKGLIKRVELRGFEPLTP